MVENFSNFMKTKPQIQKQKKKTKIYFNHQKNEENYTKSHNQAA